MNQAISACLFATLLPALAPCQGLVVPGPIEPGPRLGPIAPTVSTGLLQVRAEVRDGAMTTTVTQTLRNHTGVQQEATWLLPLPRGASADRFTMTVGGVAMPGEVLGADAARSVYEEIVRKRRDPGLLEYLGNGCLRARVFPIPPQGEVQVAVRYAQLLPRGDAVTSVHFPLRSAWLDGIGPEKVSFVVDVQSAPAIKTAWSPLPELAIARDGDHRLLASAEYTRTTLPARDLELHFGLADQDFGASVLTWRKDGQPGYFVAWFAPKRDWPAQKDLVRCVNLVLDTSGSMAGEKITQARAAVRAFVQSLAPGDWFNIVPFSTDARPFFPEPVPADAAHREEALAKVAAIEARGGTNIGDALSFALQHGKPANAGPTVVPLVIFLTDGLPTVGTTDVDALLKQVAADNRDRARVFVFGVGHDVNARLLDTIAADTRGDRDYVQPGEDIERKTGTLFAKLSGPVMTDVQFAIDGLQIDGQEPKVLPDLFVEGQLAVVGRYRGDGHKAIRLRGKVGVEPREYVFEATFPAAATDRNDWLPTLWAQRQIAALLDAIRLRGNDAELVAEVTRLGKEFGIVTPFTSHLVVEDGMRVASLRGFAPGDPMPVGAATQERLRHDWLRAGLAPPAADLPAVVTAAAAEATRSLEDLTERKDEGAAAVLQSVALVRLARDRLADDDSAIGLLHHRIGDRTFHLIAGVWVDGTLTAAAPTRQIAAFSDDYFALLQREPQLAALLAFSARMVVVTADGSAVEIVD